MNELYEKIDKQAAEILELKAHVERLSASGTMFLESVVYSCDDRQSFEDIEKYSDMLRGNIADAVDEYMPRLTAHNMLEARKAHDAVIWNEAADLCEARFKVEHPNPGDISQVDFDADCSCAECCAQGLRQKAKEIAG